MTTNFFTT